MDSVLQIWNTSKSESMQLEIYLIQFLFVLLLLLSACLQNTGIMMGFVALIWSVQLSACEQYAFVVGLVVT